jgi:hypothetical protein
MATRHSRLYRRDNCCFPKSKKSAFTSGEPIQNTPRVISVIHDSVKLARLVLGIINAG